MKQYLIAPPFSCEKRKKKNRDIIYMTESEFRTISQPIETDSRYTKSI